MAKWFALAVVGLLFFIPRSSSASNSRTLKSFRERWATDAPGLPFEKFFTQEPTETIYQNVLITLRRLQAMLQHSSMKISRFQYGYKDAAFLDRINSQNSLHGLGLAIDFLTVKDLRNVPEQQLEAWGRELNQAGLSCVFYPFRSSDRSVHVQVNLPTKRRIYYERKSRKGYKSSYTEAMNS